MDLIGLFFSAFIAATLLPGGSEVILIYLAQTETHSPLTLLAVAGIGNSLGGMVSYWIGRIIPPSKTEAKKLQTAISRLKRYGPVVLLLAWLPFAGDALCVAAGWLRISWAAAAMMIGIGKTLRYAAALAVA